MKKVTILILIAIALIVGILIGYVLKPFDLFKCFEELNFQNITCYKTESQYNCVTSDNKGYVIEHVYNK
jgi:uncharacterized membrane-anchored protein YhcB (DUF1043 family)